MRQQRMPIETLIAGQDRPLRSSQQDVRLYYKRILPRPPQSVAVQAKILQSRIF
jgi:hypothetical protein